MNRFSILVFTVASAAASAATPIDETIDATGTERLDISNVAGIVTVTGTDQDEVTITGQLSDDAEELDVRRDGDRIVVHVIMLETRGRQRMSLEGTTLEIRAPRTLAVDTQTVSASITIDDMHGEQNLTSVSGSIETALYGSEIRAKTVSGRIGVDGSENRTRADVSSVSGNVELSTMAGEVIAQTVSGRIELESPLLDRGDLQSVSGSIEIDAALANDARLRAITTSGQIRLSMRGSGAGQYELSTFSGAIDNCFGPRPARQQFGPPSSTLRFEEGDAGARIDVNSMSGSIDLCRSQ
jgi:hypothetical protein